MQKLQEETVKRIVCPRCGQDVTKDVLSMITQASGVRLQGLKNGKWLNEIATMLAVAEITLSKAGIEVDQSSIASMVLSHVEKLLSSRLSEEERDRYESDIGTLQKQLDEAKEKMKYYEGLVKQVPHIKGEEQEVSIVKMLEAVSRHTEDEFTNEKAGSLGEDIRCKIIQDGKLIDEILIESKNTSAWKNQYIEQIKTELRKRELQFGMIATKTMPKNALHGHLYVTKDGIWIVSIETVAIAYRAIRDFVIKLNMKELSKEQVEKAIRLLKEKILSKEYQGKLASIADFASSIGQEADSIEKLAQTRCSSLRNKAAAILNEVQDLCNIHDEVLKQI